MRHLLLMRGAPGSGKSTWIQKNQLEGFTICPDQVRMLYASQAYDKRTMRESISQGNDRAVWRFVYERTEERMQNGEFLVIDATNVDPKQFLDLAEKYRYRVWVKQMEADLLTCLERNHQRPEYKQVPEEVVERMWNCIQSTPLPKKVTQIQRFFSLPQEPHDVNQYKEVYVFGDLHGCWSPLEAFFQKHPWSQSSLYVFVGDYLDRGVQNKEVLEWMLAHSNEPNVVFLEGNHKWEQLWASGKQEQIKSSEFLLNTLPQIQEMDKAAVRQWCRRWRQLFWFEYNGEVYLVTHAGIGAMPGLALELVPTQMFTRGGKYEDDVDAWWEEFVHHYGLESHYQVHGHRNVLDKAPMQHPHSINLNTAVEYGEDLRVLQITEQGREIELYPVTVTSGKTNPWKTAKPTDNIALLMSQGKELSKLQELVLRLRKSPDVNEKLLKNGVSSFNFTREAFDKGKWHELSTLARSFFVDVPNDLIVARAYPKFWDMLELNKQAPDTMKNLQYPVKMYRKENGYLGLVSWNIATNEIFIATKSTDEGPFKEWFTNQLFRHWEKYGDRDRWEKLLKNSPSTMVFEVIDPVNDPHIVEYTEPKIVLLDVVFNCQSFQTVTWENLEQTAKWLHVPCKELLGYANNETELTEFRNKYLPQQGIEGFVMEDKVGTMVKVKLPWYRYWKMLRGLRDQLRRGKELNTGRMAHDTQEVVKFMQQLPAAELAQMSIIEIRNAFNKLDCCNGTQLVDSVRNQ